MKTQDLFSTFHQQEMSSYFPGSRASVRVAVALEDKQHNNKCLALSPLPPYLSTLLLNVVSEQMSYLTEYPLVSGSTVLAVSPLKILPTPSLLARGNVGETALMLWRAAQQQPKHWSVCYWHPSSHQCKVQYRERCYGKITPPQPDSIKVFNSAR